VIDIKSISEGYPLWPLQAGIAQMAASGKKPPRSIIGGAGEDDEAAD
jgi:hypothetical protein